MPLAEKQDVTDHPLPSQPFIVGPKPPIELPSTQQLAWLMVRPVSLLEERDRQLLNHVCQDPIINQVYQLAKGFAGMVRQRQVDLLNDWLASCQTCSISLMKQFGLRLQQDYAAVRAALATEWSNGHRGAVRPRVK
jgi:transposase